LLYFSLRQYINDTGTTGPSNTGRNPYKPSAKTRAQHNTLFGTTDDWGEYVFTWDSSDWQSGVMYFKPEFLDNYSNAAGHWDIQALTIKEVTDLAETKAAIEIQAQSINGLEAQYSVKIDNNGHVSGFGLSSVVVDGTPESAFVIRADKFAIVDPASTANNTTNTPSADSIPFGVTNGVVYIKSAAIEDASITAAKIGSINANTINAGVISANRISGGTIDASTINIQGVGTGLSISSASSGSRMLVASDVIKIYDGNTLRVQLGNLSA
tara:strand:+ start:2744 stop:3550 length:807 start_codon:yes stop_codon:yes gene_type:complete